MPLAAGTKLGPYEVVAPLGAGGMGEVYRARDTRLERDVALKVLPAAFASDPERMARFKREAQVLASLNHPHIGAIYGFEDAGGVLALAMELIEGPTLADHIARGPIPNDDALPVAREIAEALEAAHDRGIIHRDLKPANIKFARNGNAKVLDFGLAKAVEGDVSATDIQNSPTISRMATQAGIILGTAAYMSPEQAKGKTVDRRTDIWAFGCVLYEMLTAKHAFEGETVTDTLAAVIRAEPDWTLLPTNTRPRIREMLMRCLKKDPKQRLQSIGEARITIEGVLTGGTQDEPYLHAPAAKAPAAAWQRALPWAIAAIAVLAAIALAIYPHSSPAPSGALQASLNMPAGFRIAAGDIPVALSPDGKSLALMATGPDAKTLLYLRAMGGVTLQPLAGTEGVSYPFWSPDSQYLAFFADRKLKKIAINGGVVETITDAIDPRGGSWGPNGEIVFAPTPYGSLYSVSASGGVPVEVAPAKNSSDSNRLPHFLPDGRHVLFSREPANAVGKATSGYGIFVLDLTTKKAEPLLQEASDAAYAAPGYVFFYRGGNLMVQPFNAMNLHMGGEAVPIAEQVSYNADRWTTQFSVSQNGLLVYLKGSSVPMAQLTWFSLDGKNLGMAGVPRGYQDAAISPSGDRALVTAVNENGVPGLWMADLSRGVFSRFEPSQVGANSGIWSPDGREVLFNDDAGLLFEKAVDGASASKQISPGTDMVWVQNWSPDGQNVLWSRQNSSGVWQMGILPMTGDRKAYAYLPSQARETGPSFSADGHYVSFLSDESGTMELYAAAFPGPGGKWQVSSGGVIDGGWLRTGSKLVYVTPQMKLMEVDATAHGSELQFAKAREIFGGQPLPGFWNVEYHTFNWIAPDGKRILLPVPVAQSGSSNISLVANWPALVKKQP
jgi:Tol biopolymer transport system component